MRAHATLLLLVLALAVRAVVALRTAVPARDAAHYLWMAEQVARGDLGAAFATVFHPLYPLLTGALLALAPGLDVVRAGQIVACGMGALAVWPLCAIARRLWGEPAALAAGFFYAVGIWFARHPADALSEGPFYLLVASAVALLARDADAVAATVTDTVAASNARRTRAVVAAGVLAALAYATRPEGAWLLLVGLPWLALRHERRAALAFAVSFAVAAAPWPLGWAVLGDGFTLTPKLAFNWNAGAGASDGAVAHWLTHFVQLPGELCEELGYVATPLAALGLLCARPWRNARSAAALIVALLALQVVAIPFLRSFSRFLSGYGCLLLVFAGAAFARLQLQPRWQRLAPALRVLLVLLAVGGDLVRIPLPRRDDRRIEKDLGAWLRPQLGPDARLSTDMPRLEFYAGQRPAPPRPITAAEIAGACKSASTRYAVVVQPRTPVPVADLEALGFRPATLPEPLRAAADARGLLVYRRPDR